jgi:hypothetical protein
MAMPVKMGNPSRAMEMITMLALALQRLIKPLTQMVPTTTAPP